LAPAASVPSGAVTTYQAEDAAMTGTAHVDDSYSQATGGCGHRHQRPAPRTR